MRNHKNIIVTLQYNKFELTNRLLYGLAKNESENVDKIILVDNGSEKKDASNWYRAVDVIRLSENIGFTLGANHGLRWAIDNCDKNDLIFLISNDVQINGKFIEQAESFLLGRPCLVGNRHIAFDSGWNTFGGKTFNYLEGYFLAMTSAGWQDVGLFDPNYAPFDFEDMDLSTTAKSNGYKLVSLNNPNIVHQNGGTIGFNPEREAITLRNKEYFRKKWCGE